MWCPRPVLKKTEHWYNECNGTGHVSVFVRFLNTGMMGESQKRKYVVASSIYCKRKLVSFLIITRENTSISKIISIKFNAVLRFLYYEKRGKPAVFKPCSNKQRK